jgi:hypothetical protein
MTPSAVRTSPQCSPPSPASRHAAGASASTRVPGGKVLTARHAFPELAMSRSLGGSMRSPCCSGMRVAFGPGNQPMQRNCGDHLLGAPERHGELLVDDFPERLGQWNRDHLRCGARLTSPGPHGTYISVIRLRGDHPRNWRPPHRQSQFPGDPLSRQDRPFSQQAPGTPPLAHADSQSNAYRDLAGTKERSLEKRASGDVPQLRLRSTATPLRVISGKKAATRRPGPQLQRSLRPNASGGIIYASPKDATGPSLCSPRHRRRLLQFMETVTKRQRALLGHPRIILENLCGIFAKRRMMFELSSGQAQGHRLSNGCRGHLPASPARRC